MRPPRRSCRRFAKSWWSLGITSLLALPLSDGQDQMGVLLLAQNTARGWHSADVVVLKTISEQIVIALTNAGLRRLVKSLSVTDEQSGLLKRASYLDLLMAETRRAVQQSTPVTVTLMQFGKSAAMLKEHGEKAVEAVMQQIGQLFAANIRQNDLAFRYEKTTIALVLGETGEKEAVLAIEKLRKLLAEVKLSDEIIPSARASRKPSCASSSIPWTSSPKSSIAPTRRSTQRSRRAWAASSAWPHRWRLPQSRSSGLETLVRRTHARTMLHPFFCESLRPLRPPLRTLR